MPESALIIFDVDGTLLQTDLVTVPAVRETFAAYGLPIPEIETVRHFFGRPVEEYEDWLASQSPPGKAAELVEATNACELRMIGRSGQLYPGVRKLLDGLRGGGHTLAVCSNGPVPYVEEFLDAHELRGCFARVRARGTSGDGKTAMVREVLTHVAVRPVIVVGDRRDDVEAAHDNGAMAIGAQYGFGLPGELDEADEVVDSPAEVAGAVERLLGTA